MSQQITISGIGCAVFEKAINNLKQIETMYERYFNKGAINSFRTPNSNVGSQLILSNRYFSSLNEEPDAESIPFGPGVDPLGQLEKIMQGHLVHTSNNRVYYFKKIRDPISG